MVVKKVGMFVWNYFTNDARVTRECITLSENGYNVDLFAIHQGDLAEKERRNKYFQIYRVRKTVPFLTRLWTNKYGLIILVFCYLVLWLWLPMAMSLLLLLLLPFSLKKGRKFLSRASIFMRMVHLGMRSKYEVYHANDLNTLLQAVICAKWFGRSQLVYDSHEVQTNRMGYDNRFYGVAEQFLLRFVDVCIHENDTRAAYIEHLYGFYPKVVHNYPVTVKDSPDDAIDLYAILRIDRTEPILLYQGGIQIGRGLDKLIKAVPNIKKGVIVLIGDGRIKAELEDMVARMELVDRVKFLPKVALAELPMYTKNAYIGFQLLNNSCFNHYSASSNKLFEYMMAGIPVIACDFPEIKRVVEKHQTGIVVDSHSPLAIAAAVNQIVQAPSMRKVLSENCIKARKFFNWEQEQVVFLEIYKELDVKASARS
ncbi:glycosyltransferase [Listeria booriae]|uniref:Glycosyltransferase family 4 protein n=2 Tax=Listeria booriae TaxID=1552123 RepID=A0A842A1A9_9LIST|nr:glycosyltransferase [Listeria booriae]MBC1565653.1 glycosyltransferase family 4 protein [Listeria booriae]